MLNRKIRLVIAGGLLALTAFAIGLTISVAFNANASAPASNKSVAANVNAAPNSGANAVSENSATEADTYANFDQPPLPGTDNMDDFMNFAQDFAFNFSGMPEQFFSQAVSGTRGVGNNPLVSGVVSDNSGADKILLNNGKVTVNVNAQTTYGDANGTLTKGDLKANDRVITLGTVANNSYTARWVLRLPPLPTVKRGTVASVDAAGNKFTFKVGNDTWTASVTSSTNINKNGNKAALGDLAANDQIVVSGKADNNAKTIEAQNVIVGRMPGPGPKPGNGPLARGTVKSVDTNGNSFVVTEKVNGTDTDVTVKVDSNTKYNGQNLTGLKDLKQGDNVFVAGEKQSDGSIKATNVAKAPAGAPRPGNGGPGNRGPRGNGAGPGGNGNPANPPTTQAANG